MPTLRRGDDGDGRAVAAKSVAGGANSAEGRALAALRHPGLVELVGADGDELRTAWVNGPTLAAAGPLPAEQAAGLVAALAATLADLHDLGWVHGAVTADHVLLAPGGRPVLCGLGWAGPRASLPERPPDPSWPDDPARRPGAPLDPAFDVFALGALLHRLLDAAGAGAGGSLRALADAACDPEPWRRPSARAFAAALAEGALGARLPRRDRAAKPAARRPSPGAEDVAMALARLRADARRRAGSPRRPRRRTAGPRALLVAGLVAVGLALLAGRPAPRPAPPPARPTTTEARCDVAADAAGPGSLAADLDGDGCAELVAYAAGVLDAGDRRWALGRPGDLVALGDWDCDRRDTPAVVRPATGEVFRFDRLAGAGEDLPGTAAGRVEGARRASATDLEGDGCDELAVVRADGTEAVLRLARA